VDFFRLACRVAVWRFSRRNADVANADGLRSDDGTGERAGVGRELPYGVLLQVQLALHVLSPGSILDFEIYG
jgi:hypothetical protein